MGAVAFGAHRPSVLAAEYPSTWVAMPVVAGGMHAAPAVSGGTIPTVSDGAIIETWISDRPVVRDAGEGIASARNDDILFGCLEVDEDNDLQAATHRAYCRLFDRIDRLGYPHLLRVWNYFPRINAEVDGLERYRRFSVGRHDAFIAKGRVIGSKDVPAACALGSRTGPLVIYFFAARRAGQPVENPRQTSAYCYPAQYGPRSPTFSRALLTRTGDRPLLFLSGTASIIGHETVHIGDAALQAAETVANIGAVIKQAALDETDAGISLLLKAYLRDPAYQPMIEQHLARSFGNQAKVVYLQADICRADLLLEIEGVRLHTSLMAATV